MGQVHGQDTTVNQPERPEAKNILRIIRGEVPLNPSMPELGTERALSLSRVRPPGSERAHPTQPQQ